MTRVEIIFERRYGQISTRVPTILHSTLPVRIWDVAFYSMTRVKKWRVYPIWYSKTRMELWLVQNPFCTSWQVTNWTWCCTPWHVSNGRRVEVIFYTLTGVIMCTWTILFCFYWTYRRRYLSNKNSFSANTCQKCDVHNQVWYSVRRVNTHTCQIKLRQNGRCLYGNVKYESL